MWLPRAKRRSKRRGPPPPRFLRKCRIQRTSRLMILHVQIPQDLQAQQELGYADSKGFGTENTGRASFAFQGGESGAGVAGSPRGLLEDRLRAARGFGAVQGPQRAADGVLPGVVSLGAADFILQSG